jgi:hypothetical protein
MASDHLVECSFLIPTHRDQEVSDGELHTIDAWNWLTDQLYVRFEAWTRAPGLYRGVWKSSRTGKPVPDQSRRYIVALPPGRVDDLRRLLAEACPVFHQQCIYLSVAGQVELVEALPNGPAENLPGPEGP